jgi:para-nitrobenzyl esterase
VLPIPPWRAITAGAATSIPLLIGANRDEVRLFEVLQGTDQAGADVESLHAEMRAAGITDPHAMVAAYEHRLLCDGRSGVTSVRTVFLTDALYRIAATRLASAQTAAGGSAYQYVFSAEPFGPHLGAFHGADLSYVFDKLAEAGIDTDEQRAVRGHLMAAWSRFAHTGSPGWPPHPGTPADTVRQIGATADSCLEPPPDLAGTIWRTVPFDPAVTVADVDSTGE